LAGREVGNQELTVMMMKTESIGKRACPKGANKSSRAAVLIYLLIYITALMAQAFSSFCILTERGPVARERDASITAAARRVIIIS